MQTPYRISVEVMPIGTRVVIYRGDELLHVEPIGFDDPVPALERAGAWLAAREMRAMVQLQPVRLN